MRSSWKVLYFNFSFFKKLLNNKVYDKMRIFNRNLLIHKKLINLQLKIYDGTWYSSVVILKYQVGLKIGMLSFTKEGGYLIHGEKK
jgi:ribosomal protein S19